MPVMMRGPIVCQLCEPVMMRGPIVCQLCEGCEDGFHSFLCYFALLVYYLQKVF